MGREFEFARFRQQLRTRPQRQLLGIDIDQSTALRLLDDEQALLSEYQAWRDRAGLPSDPACPEVKMTTNRTQKPVGGTIWQRLLGR